MSKNYTSESKNHVLLLFPYEDVGLLREEVVSAATTTRTISSTNKTNINNYTVNDTNSILISSSTTATAKNNFTNNENSNYNIIKDSNKPLTPSSTSTTTRSNNTNSANTKNSEISTSSNLISSSIDEEKN